MDNKTTNRLLYELAIQRHREHNQSVGINECLEPTCTHVYRHLNMHLMKGQEDPDLMFGGADIMKSIRDQEKAQKELIDA